MRTGFSGTVMFTSCPARSANKRFNRLQKCRYSLFRPNSELWGTLTAVSGPEDVRAARVEHG